MSFSMTNVKIKSKTKFNPREYYSYVYNNPLLTKKLYNDDLDIQDFQVNEFTKPPKRLTQRITTDQEIKDYFGDIEI